MLKESYFILCLKFEKFCQRKTHKQEKNKTITRL